MRISTASTGYITPPGARWRRGSTTTGTFGGSPASSATSPTPALVRGRVQRRAHRHDPARERAAHAAVLPHRARARRIPRRAVPARGDARGGVASFAGWSGDTASRFSTGTRLPRLTVKTFRGERETRASRPSYAGRCACFPDERRTTRLSPAKTRRFAISSSTAAARPGRRRGVALRRRRRRRTARTYARTASRCTRTTSRSRSRRSSRRSAPRPTRSSGAPGSRRKRDRDPHRRVDAPAEGARKRRVRRRRARERVGLRPVRPFGVSARARDRHRAVRGLRGALPYRPVVAPEWPNISTAGTTARTSTRAPRKSQPSSSARRAAHAEDALAHDLRSVDATQDAIVRRARGDQCDVIAHSYGTVCLTAFRRHYPKSVRRCAYVDPVCFLPSFGSYLRAASTTTCRGGVAVRAPVGARQRPARSP